MVSTSVEIAIDPSGDRRLYAHYANGYRPGARLAGTRARRGRTAVTPPQAVTRLPDAHDALRRPPRRGPRGLRVPRCAESGRHGRLGVRPEGDPRCAPLCRLG